MQQRDSDVLVMGGGPAGSTIAHRLARLGHAVLLLEQSEFPRRRIGESLTPGIDPILDTLGLREQVEGAGFFRPSTAHVRWQMAANTADTSMARPGYQVDRGQFDQLLLQAARDAGTHVIQPARAININHIAPYHWQVEAATPEGKQLLSTRFLVDATGKGGLFAPKPRRLSAPTLALYAYWRPRDDVGMESRVEADAACWFWGAPLPDGSFNAAVFLDPENPLLQSRQPLEQLYEALLQRSSLLRACVCERLGPVHSCNASAYIDENPIGEDFIKVGDASFAIDPLSSQGVQAAMMSALQGSVVTNTLLTEPVKREAALEFYRLRQRDTVQRHAQWAATAYGEQTLYAQEDFWQKRSAPTAFTASDERASPITIAGNTAVYISPEVSWVEMPALVGASVKPLPALYHPGLAGPVIFVAGVALFPVLALIGPSDSLAELDEKLCRFLPGELGHKLLDWLLHNEIIVERDAVAPPAVAI